VGCQKSAESAQGQPTKDTIQMGLEKGILSDKTALELSVLAPRIKDIDADIEQARRAPRQPTPVVPPSCRTTSRAASRTSLTTSMIMMMSRVPLMLGVLNAQYDKDRGQYVGPVGPKYPMR
jgi:hypothetical protein